MFLRATDSAAVAEEPACNSTSQAFDQIAELLANGMPRRKAFKLMLAGFVGAALGKFGVRSSWADITSLCNGAPYDPTVACCTPSGLRPKHPINILAACPNRVPHPGYLAIPNGCGAEGSPLNAFIPDFPLGVNFKRCCNFHDRCWGTCNTRSGYKADCTASLLECLTQQCFSSLSSDPPLLNACLQIAATFDVAISFLGNHNFDAAQEAACDCCLDTTCNNIYDGVYGGFFTGAVACPDYTRLDPQPFQFEVNSCTVISNFGIGTVDPGGQILTVSEGSCFSRLEGLITQDGRAAGTWSQADGCNGCDLSRTLGGTWTANR